MPDQLVTLPVGLVARAILALDRDVLSLPSKDEFIPPEPHEHAEPLDEDEMCFLCDGAWVTRFGPHPVAEALRQALSENATEATS